ncbi:hypothetical protein J7E87_20025 [Streptomyces sp. ISL-1]|uniref:hypothetical protein n=1 Tax=Streptomyces sp. ISL-1 TaxID=2817657 RepID=UPI001BE87F79|nr:hypothetical protein [Streptomyces sp. ISL-1]MBT2391659.1 hypothetical protein [Streptomyces sp. ISL-1]
MDLPMSAAVPGKPADELRGLLAAVLEALDIPHPATIGDSEVHHRILADRAMHAVIALRSALGNRALLDIEWTTEYLREQLVKHPATGYVTSDQTHAALAEGKTWSEAVTLPAGEDQ